MNKRLYVIVVFNPDGSIIGSTTTKDYGKAMTTFDRIDATISRQCVKCFEITADGVVVKREYTV